MIRFLGLAKWKVKYESCDMPMVLVFFDESDKDFYKNITFVNNLSAKYNSIPFFGFGYYLFKKMCDKWQIRSFPAMIFRWDCCNKVRIYFDQLGLFNTRLISFQKRCIEYRRKNTNLKEKSLRQ